MLIINLNIFKIFINYFCYRCKCSKFGSINIEEFSRGIQSFNTNSISGVKPYVIQIKEDLLNITTPDFRQFYYFLFENNLQNPQKKFLDFDYIELYFTQLFAHQFSLVKKFLNYHIEVKKKEPVTQDQWNCFLDLLIRIGDNFPKGYSTKDSWPTLFDDFFNDYCKRNNIEIESDEED